MVIRRQLGHFTGESTILRRCLEDFQSLKTGCVGNLWTVKLICLSRMVSRQGSNPLKMGVPKRVPSLNTQVEGKCRELGGINAIHRCAVLSNRVIPGSWLLLSFQIARKLTSFCLLMSHLTAICCAFTHWLGQSMQDALQQAHWGCHIRFVLGRKEQIINRMFRTFC